MDATLSPPLLVPGRGRRPLLLSIPHAGRDYPNWLLAEARHGRKALATLEDPLVDRLAWRAIAAGFGAVIARTPRGAIDCNRSVDELDPASIAAAPGSGAGAVPVGPRARHGLGIVPSRTHRFGQLWKRPLPRARFDQRLVTAYDPYHALIADELAALRRDHASVVLLDLHSMPSRGRDAAQVVVGDRHGESAAQWMSEAAAAIVQRAGFSTAHNEPYAGGHIVERHGRPSEGVHAVQIELDRSLYLAHDMLSPGSGFDRISRLVVALADGLAEVVTPEAMAAE